MALANCQAPIAKKFTYAHPLLAHGRYPNFSFYGKI